MEKLTIEINDDLILNHDIEHGLFKGFKFSNSSRYNIRLSFNTLYTIDSTDCMSDDEGYLSKVAYDIRSQHEIISDRALVYYFDNLSVEKY